MAGTDTVGRTLADDPESPVDRDVVVVGGGAAGLSAATFLARYGFDTLVLARGKSAIRQCAVLENYPGFPAGITPERFLALGRVQVAHEGGTVREERVERVERAPIEERDVAAGGEQPGLGGFRVQTDADAYRTRYVLAATAYDGDVFEPFAEDVATDDEYGTVDSERGRTPVEGLYAAGWMTNETVHQVVVSAGHGAQAAVALVRDDVAARYWPAVADHYVDWVVDDGRYGGEDWRVDTRDWFEREVATADVDDALADEAFEHMVAEFRDREIDAAERDRRDRAGQRRLLESMDDDVVREYAAGLEEPPEA